MQICAICRAFLTQARFMPERWSRSRDSFRMHCGRDRYCVSQALLQNRKAEAGTVARMSGPDIEAITSSTAAIASPDNDLDLIARHVARIVLRRARSKSAWATSKTTTIMRHQPRRASNSNRSASLGRLLRLKVEKASSGYPLRLILIREIVTLC